VLATGSSAAPIDLLQQPACLLRTSVPALVDTKFQRELVLRTDSIFFSKTAHGSAHSGIRDRVMNRGFRRLITVQVLQRDAELVRGYLGHGGRGTSVSPRPRVGLR